MITLKKGNSDRYKKSQRKRDYLQNPVYKKRCEMCGAKFLFTNAEIVPQGIIRHDNDYVTCPECGQRVLVVDPDAYIPYWRWRLFYEKRYSDEI